jgi:hypothetical protein
VASPRTMPNLSQSHERHGSLCTYEGLSAPPTLTVVSASSARLKTPYFFFVQGPPLKMVPPQMIIGHPLKHTPLTALLYRSLTSPPDPRMDVQVVRVLQGTALSAPITITRDASGLNIPS